MFSIHFIAISFPSYSSNLFKNAFTLEGSAVIAVKINKFCNDLNLENSLLCNTNFSNKSINSACNPASIKALTVTLTSSWFVVLGKITWITWSTTAFLWSVSSDKTFFHKSGFKDATKYWAWALYIAFLFVRLINSSSHCPAAFW